MKLIGNDYRMEATLESGDSYESDDFPGLRLNLSDLFEDIPGEDD